MIGLRVQKGKTGSVTQTSNQETETFQQTETQPDRRSHRVADRRTATLTDQQTHSKPQSKSYCHSQADTGSVSNSHCHYQRQLNTMTKAVKTNLQQFLAVDAVRSVFFTVEQRLCEHVRGESARERESHVGHGVGLELTER